MSYTPVFRTIREPIDDRIRADVISGRLAEGIDLREQALVQQYRGSRAPIRDALEHRLPASHAESPPASIRGADS